MNELELVIQTGDDLVVEEDIFELVFSGAPGPVGAGLPSGGLINQLIRKTSSVIDHATEWFTATYADFGAAPADEGVTNGNTHDHSGGDGGTIDHVNLASKGTNTHAQIDTKLASSASHIADTKNPHQVEAVDVAEDVHDNGIITVDTVIDWANGAVQSVTMGAIANLSFTGWGSLGTTDDGKAQDGSLIIIDGDLFAPTFDDVNQGPLPTYVAGFACLQELASLGPDGAIYNMGQVWNDQHILLGPELWNPPPGSLGVGWSDLGGGIYQCDGTQASQSDINETLAADLGGDYYTLFEVLTLTAGEINILVGGQVGLSRNITGVYEQFLNVTTTGTKYGARANANFAGTIRIDHIRKAL